MFEIAKMLK